MSHTPGPWKQGFVAASEKRPVWTAIEADGFSVATVGRYLHNYNKSSRPTREIPDAEALANARLIAAAPELLAKLQEIKDWADDRADINWNDQPNDAMEVQSMIGDIIAKATGGAK